MPIASSLAVESADVVITGGGTAGHVFPALAVARALVARGHAPERIHFVGARNGMEGRLVPEAGFGVTLLPGRGIVRRASLGNVVAVGGLIQACLEAQVLMWHLRPRVVVSLGGFAGVPATIAAAVRRIPVVIVNVDAVPGLANRLAAKVALASAVATEGTELPHPVVTGAPVRDEILAVDRSKSSREMAGKVLDIASGRRVIAVTGGSLGARRLNDLALGLAARFAQRKDITVYHVAGARDFERVLAAANEAGLQTRRIRTPHARTLRGGRFSGHAGRRDDRRGAVGYRHAIIASAVARSTA